MLLLTNGKILTFNKNSEIIENGAILIKDNKIAEVGNTENLKEKYPATEEFDVNGKIVMPGLVNTHMHFYSTFARGMDLKTDQPPQNFVDILEKLWWRLDKNLNEEDIYYSTIYALLSSIKAGTTTIFDHHASYGYINGSLDLIAEAVKKAGIRANLSYEISDRHGEIKAEKALNENERFLKKLDSEDNLLSGTIGLHASFTLSDDTLTETAALSENLDVPIHIHCAEGYADVKDSKDRGFKGVVDRLNNYNLWRENSLAIHGVHLQKGEAEILRENGVNLIHNPESNMSNAVGTAQVNDASQKAVRVGLGTDGYTTDMFESLSVANLLQTHERGNPSVGGELVKKMAIQNNQNIASDYFKGNLGAIKKGNLADIIVLDYNSPTPINKQNIFGHMLMGFKGGIVDSTIVNGNILMKNQEVQVLDEKRLLPRIRKQAEDFWQRF
ncbi:MAG TPA: putative aminohydrolase SsnA [Halanaerobiales bacterium]|nr:putative aminohydrolase SsnA [Halanaerobiales bacterium]